MNMDSVSLLFMLVSWKETTFGLLLSSICGLKHEVVIRIELHPVCMFRFSKIAVEMTAETWSWVFREMRVKAW